MDNKLADFYEGIIKGVGEDPSREGLQKTPERAAKAMQYLTRGYTQSAEELVNNAIFESENNQMILVKDIELYSLCEHHLLPFIGKCHVAYIPTGKVIGLSKIARIVDMFARRLQIQENLTKQIADTLMTTIAPAGVGVIIEAKHLCMMMRGVEKQNSMMTTSMMLGAFRDHDRTRSEFLELVKS
jgi:GTP cyclohydrolase I